MNFPDLKFVDRAKDPAEWRVMWAALVAHWGGDVEDLDPDSGERWQYMGTSAERGAFLHDFRHRRHPRTLKREYWRWPATAAWATAHGLALKGTAWGVSRNAHPGPKFDPYECGGVFDGVNVSSDADPGL